MYIFFLRILQEKDVASESPMSVAHDSSVMSITVTDTSTLQDDEEEDVVVAQTNRENFYHVVEYRDDIYNHMKELEVSNESNVHRLMYLPKCWFKIIIRII